MQCDWFAMACAATTQATRAAIKREAKGSFFDVVVHDGAPNVGGAWANEAYTQVGREARNR
jgi:23S rRNA U2552 (ribose-2'-O)-methylase RlmE/FtsJ